MDGNDTGWTCVATFSNQGEAYIAAGHLESEGIPTVINNATISTVYPMTDTWAPLELLVPDELLAKSREILKL